MYCIMYINLFSDEPEGHFRISFWSACSEAIHPIILSQRAVRGVSGLTSEMTLLGYIEILLEDR